MTIFGGGWRSGDRLLSCRPEEALGLTAEGEGPAEELLEALIPHLLRLPGYARDGRAIRRPDGVSVPLDGAPLAVAGRLVQDDLLLMLKPAGGGEHVLVAGALCVPAHWTLTEKIGRPFLRIHRPVPDYPGDMERRVQRLFGGVQPGRPLWRANWRFAASPEIVTPMREAEKTAAFASRLAQDDKRGCAWSARASFAFRAPGRSSSASERS